MSSPSVDVAEDLVERSAGRAAELVAERQGGPAATEEEGWLRGAERSAEYINAPRSRVYGLVSARRIVSARRWL